MSVYWKAALALSLLASICRCEARAIPRFAYVANNQDDTVSIFAIHKSGLRAVGYVYTGPGSNPRSVVVTPSQSFLYVAEGNVGIAGYAVNNLNGSLSPVPGSPFLTGSEFSISMHPGGKFLVAVSGTSVSTFAIDPVTGVLTSIQTLSGSSPISAAIDPTGAFLYAANVNSNTISAFTFNQSSGILTPVTGSPFPSGPSPQSIVIDSHCKFLYAPNGNGASVSAYAIDRTTGALTSVPGSPFATGSVPVTAAIVKSYVFVGNSADKTISQFTIDPTTGSLSQLAPPFSTRNSGPLALAANPAQPLLYVADHDSDEVLVLGITAKHPSLFYESIIRSRGSAISIALASGSAQVSYSPKFVYECNSTSNDIWGYQVTAASGSLAELSVSPFATGISPQSLVSDLRGAFVFSANQSSNDVSAFTIDPETGALVPVPGSPFPAGMQPSAVAVDNSAHFVYVTNSLSNTISGYSVGAGGVLAPVPGSPFAASGTAPQALVIDPRGKFVYAANALSNTLSIFEIDAGTGALQNVASVSTGDFPTAVAMTRDGRYVYVLNQSSQSISGFAVDSVTGQVQQISSSPFGVGGPPFSMVVDPVGTRLYAGETTTIVGYRLFDDRGYLRPLPRSPFNGVSSAYGLGIDLSDSFLYAANKSGSSISGFRVDTSGDLLPLSNSPYSAGTNPTSVAVVSTFQ